MSLIDRTRVSAGATLNQSKSSLATASERLRVVPGGTRDLTRSAVTLGRQQAYVTLGFSDAVVATLTRQRETLPVQLKQYVVQLAETAGAGVGRATYFVNKAQEKIASTTGELTERSADVAASARKFTPAATVARLKDTAEGRTSQAKDAYAKLSVRGEQVATDLRHDPVLVRVIGEADNRVGHAANAVTSVAQKVRTRALAQAKRERSATTSTPVRATPANKIPAHRTTIRKTPAEQAAVSTTPTHRAAAQETATREAAAKKAAATRKANAEQAAATRQAAAEKAAATRKKAAAEREQAAKARHDAAVKAAATRKKNAADA